MSTGARSGLRLASLLFLGGCTLIADLDGMSEGPRSEPDASADAAPAPPGSSPGPGDGRDGVRVVSGVEAPNVYAALARSASPADTMLVVEPSLVARAGDVVLVWQVTGQAVTPPGTASVAVDDVGVYELHRVAGVRGAEIDLERPLTHAYRADVSQVVLVPQYEELTVMNGAVFGAKPWDGRTGGVLAVMVRGALHNQGLVHANASGFRGGRSYRTARALYGCGDAFDGVLEDGFAAKGEGLVPSAYSPDGGAGALGGRGNVTIGGGGGHCHNAGGAGGGNGSPGGSGGTSSNFLDRPDGGGPGGMGGSAVELGSLLTRLMMGGGGGAGERNNVEGERGGGAGGGIVLVHARTVDGFGLFSADGEGGELVENDGAAGGGAGGSVVVRVVGVATCSVTARGGAGGSTSDENGIVGPGGGGGGGRALVQASDNRCSIQVGSGVAGTVPEGGTGATPLTSMPGIVETAPPEAYVP